MRTSFSTLQRAQQQNQDQILCDQCNYKATQNGSLKTHKTSIQEGVILFCDQCNHKSTTKNPLNMHKMSIHDIVVTSVTLNQCIKEH